MRRRKPFLLLIMATILGFLATTATARYLERQGEAVVGSGVIILTAASDIPPGTLITSEHLTEMNWPQRSAPGSFATKIDDVLNRYACLEIAAGEPILKRGVSEHNYAGNLVNHIPPGFRAMTIKIDRAVQSGGLITPGSLVDVISVTNDRGRNPVSRTILQGIRIISVGARSEDGTTSAQATGREETVTLLLKPWEAEQLALAISKGAIQVMARGASDTEITASAGVSDVPRVEAPVETPSPAPVKPQAEAPEVVAERFFNRGRTAEAKSEWEEAAGLYGRIIEEFPDQQVAVKAVERLNFVREQIKTASLENTLADALGEARKKMSRGMFDECRKRLDAINREFGTMTYKAHKVNDLVASLINQARDSERQANVDFQMFRNLVNNNNREHALQYLRKLDEQYPESRYYVEAAAIALQKWGADVLGKSTGELVTEETPDE